MIDELIKIGIFIGAGYLVYLMIKKKIQKDKEAAEKKNVN